MVERITPAQIRGARGMLDWSMVDLARAAGVSVSTIKRAEAAGQQMASGDALLLVQTALERQGVNFLYDEVEGPGLRLRPHEASPVARFF